MLLHEKNDNREPTIQIFNIAPMSHMDGPGRRVVVFCQECLTACSWCHSPHSQPKCAPLLFFEERCNKCGMCEKACKSGVHKISNNKHFLHRELCIKCGDCIDACPSSSRNWDSGILQLQTRTLSIYSLYEQLKPYLALCDGITISGGEALLQLNAVLEFIKLCKRDHIDVALETSGLLKKEVYQEVFPYIDTWLFGARLITTQNGIPNTKQIEETLNILSRNAKNIIPRIPIVPGITDREDILKILVDLFQKYSLNHIWLNPWNINYDIYYQASGMPILYEKPKRKAIEKSSVKIKDYFIRNGFKIL